MSGRRSRRLRKARAREWLPCEPVECPPVEDVVLEAIWTVPVLEDPTSPRWRHYAP